MYFVCGVTTMVRLRRSHPRRPHVEIAGRQGEGRHAGGGKRHSCKCRAKSFTMFSIEVVCEKQTTRRECRALNVPPL